MERNREGRSEGGIYLPDSALEARSLAEMKLSEAGKVLLNNPDSKGKRRAKKLRMEAERLEVHAFNIASDQEDFEMMGVSVVSAVEIRILTGDLAGAKGLGMVGLNAIGDRSPEFKDRILENLDKIKNRQKRA